MKRLRRVANIDALIKEVQEIGYPYLLDTIRSVSNDRKIKDASLGYALESVEGSFDDDQIEELKDYFFDTPIMEFALNNSNNEIERLAKEIVFTEIKNTVEGSGKEEELKNRIVNNLKGSYTDEEIARLNNISIVSCILGVATAII